MIIHIWMHWFWITTAYFKGFIFFTSQTISFASLFHSCTAEAGLLGNRVFITVIPHSYDGNHSSQVGHDPDITSPIVIDDANRSTKTTPQQSSTSSLQAETESEESTTSKFEESAGTAFGFSSDAADTYNGGNVDAFQYPLKKFTKYSHLKYRKVKAKGKTNEDVVEERKVESARADEEKVNVSVSLTEVELGRSGPEIDKSNGNLTARNESEAPSSDAPDLITTTLTVESVTSEERNWTLENFPKEESNITVEYVTETMPTEDQREVKSLKNETLVIENKVEDSGTYTTVEPFVVQNRVAAATSAQNYEAEQSEMNAGSITGIILGVLVVFSLFGTVSFVLYRRRYLNKPQVLHDKCSNLDSSGYIDETSLRENSEEMYSLDNDSFLNSLEAMTIQNYWTENVKHTKL